VLRDATQPDGASDRARRERLEALQAQLKEARGQLADVEGSTRAAVHDLEEALARAQVRVAVARARGAELEERKRAARARLVELREKQLEAEALALGATRRDTYVDGVSVQPQHRGRNPLAVVLAVVLSGFGLFVLSAMINGCLH
jgi:chromosome segregation ATPase